jgi:hypothetical protein
MVGAPLGLITGFTFNALQAYTCSHYTCPICSKSLGDMAVSFLCFPSPVQILVLTCHLQISISTECEGLYTS